MPPPSHHIPVPEWIGFLGYEMGAYSDQNKLLPYYRSTFPYSYFQRCAVVIQVDHRKKEGRVFIANQAPYLLDQEQIRWIQRLSDKKEWMELIKHLDEPLIPKKNPLGDELQRQMTKEEYISNVERALEWIRSGLIYQVNLSQTLSVKNEQNPFDIFLDLILMNPSPFSADFRTKDQVIVSSSPERFLKLEEGILETRPIKGTIPRGRNEEEDQKNRNQLINSIKDNAELLMITDLMRNDLSKVSEIGSVKTIDIGVS